MGVTNLVLEVTSGKKVCFSCPLTNLREWGLSPATAASRRQSLLFLHFIMYGVTKRVTEVTGADIFDFHRSTGGHGLQGCEGFFHFVSFFVLFLFFCFSDLVWSSLGIGPRALLLERRIG